MVFKLGLGMIAMGASLLVNPVFAAERHIMEPRVPADKLKEARALVSPLPDSPEIVEQGKIIYEGKGTCFNCHGKTGRGDGPGGLSLNPSPRNFWHHGMWRHRSEGEIFWVIKHGSPGTGMIPFGGLLSDEEIWTVMQYERSFSMGRGPGGMGRHRGMGPMGHGGPGGGHGMGGPHGRHSGPDECCQEK
ncbi:MAG: c-type cytochrome [Nitrospirota bacterium]|nr:c-type cytochrome [Nitrospirota bacterium]MDH5585676.1 c-type cytochrome [Nitrospirota bacterium]